MAGSELGEINEVTLPELGEGGTVSERLAEAFEAAELGEDLGHHLNGIGEDLGQSWVADLDGTGEGLNAISETMAAGLERLQSLGDGLGVEFSNAVEGLSAALTEAMDGILRGLEWLKEHPEVIESAAHLFVIGVGCVESPEMMARYLSENPGAISDRLEIIHAAMA